MTRQIEAQSSAKKGSFAPGDEHRYAYPVFFAFLFLPLALLPFGVAQQVALVTGAMLSVFSVRWWLPCDAAGAGRCTLITMLFFATYPAILSLQLRQPTVLIAAMLAAVIACLRRKHLILGGILTGLSMAKPQIAVPVLLPLLVWTVAHWRSRKSFLLTLCGTVAVLLIASELLIPGWFYDWVGTVQAYRHYAGANPPLMEILPRDWYFGAVAVFAIAVIWIAVRFRDADLLLPVSFSIAAFQLLVPLQIYNQVLLLAPTIWLAQNRAALAACGQIGSLLRGLAGSVLALGWGSQMALSAADLLAGGSGEALWQAPLVAAWLYPWPLFLTLVVAAFVLSSPSRPAARSTARCAWRSADV